MIRFISCHLTLQKYWSDIVSVPMWCDDDDDLSRMRSRTRPRRPSHRNPSDGGSRPVARGPPPSRADPLPPRPVTKQRRLPLLLARAPFPSCALCPHSLHCLDDRFLVHFVSNPSIWWFSFVFFLWCTSAPSIVPIVVYIKMRTQFTLCAFEAQTIFSNQAGRGQSHRLTDHCPAVYMAAAT